MFKQAIIHYPSDEKALVQISKEITAFRCLSTIKYLESLKMNDKRQIETLYAILPEEIATRKQKMQKK